ncbi:hypothetical protein MMC07_002703 [Pseudocyphellaria aurata]|nr:hypothetical protein [Pseudocyphellaria aurata]
MCHVIRHVYRHCEHHHHWELAIACYRGFDTTRQECKVHNHECIRETYVHREEPLCCEDCLLIKTQWIEQALLIMLIQLKAATMTRPNTSDEELRWKFRTWRTKCQKEIIRTFRLYGYDAADGEFVPQNPNEDEFDADWHFPVPQAEIQAQLRDLTDRIRDGDVHAQHDFWWDRNE